MQIIDRDNYYRGLCSSDEMRREPDHGRSEWRKLLNHLKVHWSASYNWSSDHDYLQQRGVRPPLDIVTADRLCYIACRGQHWRWTRWVEPGCSVFLFFCCCWVSSESQDNPNRHRMEKCSFLPTAELTRTAKRRQRGVGSIVDHDSASLRSLSSPTTPLGIRFSLLQLNKRKH